MGAILSDQPELWEWAKDIGATEIEKFVLWMLRGATSAKPLSIAVIQFRLKNELHSIVSPRSIKDWVRTLRREHGMPVLARRGNPPGYYWCKNEDEMRGFVRTFKRQADDELATVRNILAKNYPGLLRELDSSALEGTL